MGVKHVDQVCHLQSMAGDRGDRGPNRVTAPPFEIAPPPQPGFSCAVFYPKQVILSSDRSPMGRRETHHVGGARAPEARDY